MQDMYIIWCSVSPRVEYGWGNLTQEVKMSLFLKDFYYFSDDWVTDGMYFSVFAISEKKQKF